MAESRFLQAIDRVHRFGQKEDVEVVRLTIKNTIEDRILELQEHKRGLAKCVFRLLRANASTLRAVL